MQRQREREGRGLFRLSTELYSRDTHFVLELVQNADDNSYPSDCSPSLAFLLEHDKIVVLNNESGFTEKNIRALCDVGKSTKGQHRYGYIGEQVLGHAGTQRVFAHEQAGDETRENFWAHTLGPLNAPIQSEAVIT